MKRFSIGRGVSYRPAIHTGEGSGSTAIINASSGQIFAIEEDNCRLSESLQYRDIFEA